MIFLRDGVFLRVGLGWVRVVDGFFGDCGLGRGGGGCGKMGGEGREGWCVFLCVREREGLGCDGS